MSQEEWRLEKYVTDRGDCPFDDWFASLDAQTRARINARLTRLRLGNFGDFKGVGAGVYELRLFFGPGYRVYYGLAGKQVVLLLAGGTKKQQDKDIRTAQQFWTKYRDEQGEG